LVVIDKERNNTYLDAMAGGRHTFAVVYECFTPATKMDVVLAIVTSKGEVLGPAVIANSSSYESYARVAYSSGDYLIAWYDSRDRSIYGTIYNEEGQPLKGKFLIARTNEPYSLASLQVYGGEAYFLVVYRKYDGIQHGVYAKKVNLDGSVGKEFKVLDDPDVNEDLSNCFTGSQSPTYSGKVFIPVVGGGNVYLAVVDANAGRTINTYVLSTAGVNPYVAVDKITGSIAVAWVDYRNDSLGDINVAFINATKLGKPIEYDVSVGLKEIPEWSPTISFSRAVAGLVVLWGGRINGYGEVFSTVVKPNEGSLGVVKLIEYGVPNVKVCGLVVGHVKSWGGFLAPLTFFRSTSDYDLYLVEGNIFKDIISGTASSPSSVPLKTSLPTLKPRVITTTFTLTSTTTMTKINTTTVSTTVTVSTTSTVTKKEVTTVTEVKTKWAGTLTLTRTETTIPSWVSVTLGSTVILAGIVVVLLALLLRAKGVKLQKPSLGKSSTSKAKAVKGKKKARSRKGGRKSSR